MRISQSLFFGDHLRTIGQNRKKTMEKLSSGLAINRAGDDAAGPSMRVKSGAKVSGSSIALRDIMDGKKLSDVAAFKDIKVNLVQMYSISENAIVV